MQIPGFEILKEVFRGPMTTALVARQKATGKIVLLKLLHPQYGGDPEISKRFSREAEVVGRFDHENIIKVLDHSAVRDQSYMVMEYIDGWNLSEFIKKNHPLPTEVVLSVFTGYLNGLRYAHDKGVIHRDIKPSNILIGKDGSVKLTDFGLARPQDVSAVTEQGRMIGTPGYTAPEILQGQSASVESDIFSAGVTLCELLTGENPYRGESLAVTIHNIINRKPACVSGARSDLPQWLERLALQMTAADKSERPRSADKILKDAGLLE